MQRFLHEDVRDADFLCCEICFLLLLPFFYTSVSLCGLQAVIKQFSGSGYESSAIMVIDEIELQRHQQLDKLYKATRAGRVVMLKLSISLSLFTFTMLLIFPDQEDNFIPLHLSKVEYCWTCLFYTVVDQSNLPIFSFL